LVHRGLRVVGEDRQDPRPGAVAGAGPVHGSATVEDGHLVAGKEPATCGEGGNPKMSGVMSRFSWVSGTVCFLLPVI